MVELRFFAGCTIEETAKVLAFSTPAAKRQWRLARIWLQAALLRKTRGH